MAEIVDCCLRCAEIRRKKDVIDSMHVVETCGVHGFKMRWNLLRRLLRYREARRTAFCQSLARLQNFAAAAVTTVLKIMLDTNAPAGTRLRAAEVVLERGGQALEMEDIEARVAELERAANSVKRSPTRSAIPTLVSTKALSGPTMPAQISAPCPGSSEADGDDGA